MSHPFQDLMAASSANPVLLTDNHVPLRPGLFIVYSAEGERSLAAFVGGHWFEVTEEEVSSVAFQPVLGSFPVGERPLSFDRATVLEEALKAYLSKMGVCDGANDPDRLVCDDPGCSYCMLVRLIDGEKRL